jgi:hypothetical protein
MLQTVSAATGLPDTTKKRSKPMKPGALQFGGSWLAAIASRLSRLAQSQALSVTLIGLLAFGGSAAVGLMLGIREPRVHDEFSYLLAADTFANGRLTNPTHPMWIHFESLHIIHQPTYASKYPPAQGLILAAGQVIGGHPIVGVWIGMGLMCAAICWMLYAWVPPRWAVLGGVLAILHPVVGIGGEWAQSYWRGAVAAFGGALVLGGLRRIMRRPHTHDALLLGLGLAVLANSRPYEGLLFSLPAGVALLVWMLGKNGPAIGVSIERIVLPIFIVLALTGTAMGLYNLRITGNVFRMPYQVYEETYTIKPLFRWGSPRPEPTYRHQIMSQYHHEFELNTYTWGRSISGFLSQTDIRFRMLWNYFYGEVFTVPLLAMLPVMLPWMSRNRWALFALLNCSVGVGALLMSTWATPHYAAPILCLIFLFVLQAMRLWRWRDRAVGQFVLWLVFFLCIYSVGRSLSGAMQQDDSSAWYQQRARILKHLENGPGRHLIIVRYGPKHSIHDEWVYNKPDIDSAKVVWARDMDKAQNHALVDYFKDRQLWLLEVDLDRSTPELKPYPKT